MAFFAGLLKENQAYKLALLVFFISNLVLLGLLFYGQKRGKEIYAFDSSTGHTYTTARISSKELDNLVLAATKSFVFDFLNFDYAYIEKARLSAFLRMSPALQQKYKDELSAEEPIKEAIAGHARFDLVFLTEPALIVSAHPNYKTFCKVKRVIRFENGKELSSEHNLRITWKMTESTPKRPDGLFVTDVERISADDKETLNSILNQIQ